MKSFGSIRNIIAGALVFSTMGAFISEAAPAKKPVSYKCPQCNTRRICSNEGLQNFCIQTCKGTMIKTGLFKKKSVAWDPAAAWKKNCRKKPLPNTWGGAQVQNPGLAGSHQQFYQAGPGAAGASVGSAGKQPELAANPPKAVNPPKVDQYVKAGTPFYQAGPGAAGAPVGSASSQPAGAFK